MEKITIGNKKTSVRTTGQELATLEKVASQASNTESRNSQEFNLSIFDIRDGKVNLTKICQRFGKDVRKWTKQEGVKSVLSVLEEAEPNVAHLQVVNGIGTFGSREVTIKLAQWISPEFEVFCLKKLDTLFQTGKVEMRPETQPQASLPDFSNPATAARAWADEYEQKLVALRQASEIKKELEHKQEIIMDRIADIPPQTMRTKLNKICRWTDRNDFQYRWRTLYKEFGYTYGFNLKERAENSKMAILDYAEKFGCLEDLYNLALKLFETEKDGRQLILT